MSRSKKTYLYGELHWRINECSHYASKLEMDKEDLDVIPVLTHYLNRVLATINVMRENGIDLPDFDSKEKIKEIEEQIKSTMIDKIERGFIGGDDDIVKANPDDPDLITR